MWILVVVVVVIVEVDLKVYVKNLKWEHFYKWKHDMDRDMYHSGTLYSESTFDIDNGIIQQQLCAMKKSTV